MSAILTHYNLSKILFGSKFLVELGLSKIYNDKYFSKVNNNFVIRFLYAEVILHFNYHMNISKYYFHFSG